MQKELKSFVFFFFFDWAIQWYLWDGVHLSFIYAGDHKMQKALIEHFIFKSWHSKSVVSR